MEYFVRPGAASSVGFAGIAAIVDVRLVLHASHMLYILLTWCSIPEQQTPKFRLDFATMGMQQNPQILYNSELGAAVNFNLACELAFPTSPNLSHARRGKKLSCLQAVCENLVTSH